MKPYRLVSELIVFFIFSFLFSGNINAETEPNNTFSNANLIGLNVKSIGTLSSTDEIDFYKIVINEDGRLSILDTTSANLDYYVNLYDSDGTTLIRSVLRYNSNTGSRIALNLSPGIYYFKLDRYGNSSDGSYSVYPLFEPVSFPGDPEPNDLVSSATALILNKQNSGNLGSRRDGIYDKYDYWQITIPEDGRLTIQDTTESPLDYFIRLYDADGTTLIRSELRYENNSGARIALNVSPGIYYLQLDKYSVDYSTYGSYTIYPLFEPVSFPGDLEPNDSVSSATALSLNSQNSGNLGSRRDGAYDKYDYWKIDILEDGRLSVLDTTESHLDYYIRLYDANGTTLIRSELRYNNNTGKRIALNLSPGTYYLRLDKYSVDYHTYGSYTIYPLFEPVSFPGDTEPNDSVFSANNLILNTRNSGNLGSRRDGAFDKYDYWKINIVEDGRLSILDTTESNLDYFIRLYDGNGTTEIRSELRYNNNTGSRIALNLSPGTYFLRLDKYSIDYSTYGSYKIYPLFEPVTFPADSEPNDSILVATNLNLNNQNSGNLGSRRDGIYDKYDYWKINIVEDGRLSILDTTESHLDYYIRLYDVDGTTLIRSELRYDNNTGQRIAVNVSPGIYYLQLQRYSVNYHTYGSYTIFPHFKQVSYPGDSEPNDSISVAKLLQIDTLVSGNLGSWKDGAYDDFDWWRIELAEDGIISLNDTTESNLDYYMKLYDSEGSTLIRSVLRHKNNSGSRISEKLTKGTYFLLIDRYSGNYYTYGTYIINSDFRPNPKADFEISQDIKSVSITNLSTDGESFFWDFDDGETSGHVNPSHTYDGPGEYLITLIVSNEAGADTVSQQVVIYGVSLITPQTGGDFGDVTITILGGGFSEEASIILGKEGSPNITATQVHYVERGAIQATFNLSGADLGIWDLTVNNPGKLSILKENAFTIVPATEPEPWVNLSGRSRALFNRWQTYTLEYGNTGNVDADIVPVWITVSNPGNNELEFTDLEILYPDYVEDNNLDHRFDSIVSYFDLDTLWGKFEPTRVYPLYIPKIPAGYSGNIKFRIKTSDEVKIHVWNNSPLMENGLLKALCLEGNSLLGKCIEEAKIRALRDLALTYIGIIPGAGCITSVAKEFFAIRDMRMADYSKRRSWGSFTYAMTGLFLGCVSDLIPISAIYDLAISVTGTIQFLHDGIYQADKDCHEKFGINSHKSQNIRGVNSFDPNEIVGPVGYGLGNYIEPVGTAVYTIFFENKKTATAPAQEIWVTDTLDLTKFNINEFSFKTVSIADTTIDLLFGQKEFTIDIDFRPSKQIIGRVIGQLDTLNGIVSVYINSLDPTTMSQNEDPALGILPPNTTSPEGEGSVSYSLGLYDLGNGESFENKAEIIFDFNKPIFTNTWSNTIDDEAPESKIESFDYDPVNREVQLNITGNDNLSGIDFFTIYVSVNDSSYIPVIRTSENNTIYKAQEAQIYKFYSVATDSLGYIEAAPNMEDVQIMVTGIPDWSNNLNDYSVYPNPAYDVVTIKTNTPGIKLVEFIKLDGTVVQRELIKENQKNINISNLKKGIYLVKISNEKSFSIEKIIIN